MWKKLILPLFIVFFLFPSWSFAHTGLKEAKPAKDEIIQGTVKEIELSFNTKIEKGSTFTLKKSKEKAIPISFITVEEQKMKGSLEAPLADGTYEVQWKIIGADGHPIEGSYGFEVKDSGVKTDTTAQQPTQSEENVATKETAKQPVQQATQSQSSSLLVYILIGLLVLGALFGFWWLFGRKTE